MTIRVSHLISGTFSKGIEMEEDQPIDTEHNAIQWLLCVVEAAKDRRYSINYIRRCEESIEDIRSLLNKNAELQQRLDGAEEANRILVTDHEAKLKAAEELAEAVMVFDGAVEDTDETALRRQIHNCLNITKRLNG